MAVGGEGPADESSSKRSVVRRLRPPRSMAGWVLLIDIGLVLLFAAITADHVFLSWENERALALNMTEITLLDLGLAMLIGAGAFDLPVGANLALSSVIGARVLTGVGNPRDVDPG